ncbi:MAG: SWIM zinc finger family protein [Steroidobacteraceae bacterium]
MSWWSYARKPSASEQRQRAAREGQRLAKRLAKMGRKASAVVVEGRTIARTFWGKAWCENLESYRDYEYRLPRGRSYLRNGAVLDLDISAGRIAAVVSGTSLYDVDIKIKPVAAAHWRRIKTRCSGQIGSLIELLEGRLSDGVMGIITRREQGLFPKPAEIDMTCSCPDWATMCKHVAAVMYGVGARLDEQPALLFTLRKVDHEELIAEAANVEVSRRSGRKTLTSEELGGVFGIELAEAPAARPAAAKAPRRKARKPGRVGKARSKAQIGSRRAGGRRA